MPLAGGENCAGYDAFKAVLTTKAVDVVQPDIAKWGGFTGCLTVARDVIAASRRYCPHFLGGGIGLVASAHLLAAAGGDGSLEVDANANPPCDLIAHSQATADGRWRINSQPGLGVEALPIEVNEFLTLRQEAFV